MLYLGILRAPAEVREAELGVAKGEKGAEKGAEEISTGCNEDKAQETNRTAIRTP